ncbi:MAG: extracellular solute-binding protein [Actinomycetota bacterium]|nr:extracellular solute-binding protein [Actinomycetota bacterium]
MLLDRRARSAVTIAGVFICTTFLISACGGSSEGSGKTLNWFVAIQPGGSIQEVAKQCTEQSGGRYEIQLELLPTDADPQREQLVRRLGAEDTSVDLIGMDIPWTAEFANAGWLREWTGAEAEQVSRDAFDSAVEAASFEDKLYGAPFNSNTQLLFYRKDLVPTPPTTWDQMIDQAEQLGSTIQVQAQRYEGYVVLFNTLLASAGGEILSGPEEVDLPQGPTEAALEVIGKLANSAAAPADIATSDEDSARLGYESGASAFMINYTFAFGSAGENAPDIQANTGVARYPEVVPGQPSHPPIGGFNIGVSSYSEEPELAFEAATCITSPEGQLTATELDGLPPSNQTLYSDPIVTEAYPGFAELVKQSLDDSAPRPLTPAYTDLSLAIQRTLHPPDKIDPSDVGSTYEELRANAEDAVKREGLQ